MADLFSAPRPVTLVNGDGSPVYGSNGKYAFVVPDVPVVTAGAYSINDVMGGYRTVELAEEIDRPFYLFDVTLKFKANASPSVRVVLFGATPGATIADNAAFTLSGDDAAKVRRTLETKILGTVYSLAGTGPVPRIGTLSPSPFIMKPIPGTKTIGYYVVDDTGVTLGSTSDLTVEFSGTGI